MIIEIHFSAIEPVNNEEGLFEQLFTPNMERFIAAGQRGHLQPPNASEGADNATQGSYWIFLLLIDNKNKLC